MSRKRTADEAASGSNRGNNGGRGSRGNNRTREAASSAQISTMAVVQTGAFTTHLKSMAAVSTFGNVCKSWADWAATPANIRITELAGRPLFLRCPLPRRSWTLYLQPSPMMNHRLVALHQKSKVTLWTIQQRD